MNYLSIRTLKVLIVLNTILFFTSCQQEPILETEEEQNTHIRTTPRVQVKVGDKVSKKAITFLKEKTNKAMRVALSKKKIVLSDGNAVAKETALGTINIDKEIVVINATNIKHTFKIDTILEDTNSITNIVIVETPNGLYEYFLKYTFTETISFQPNGALDLSVFSGSIETYNRYGDTTGTIVILDGDVIEVSGVTTPCPENDQWEGWDTYWGDDSDVPVGGGGTFENPDNTTATQGNNNGGSSGSGTTGDCGLNYYYEACNGGVEGEHEPTTNSDLPGGICSGAGPGYTGGSGNLVITDCNNVILASGRNVNARDMEADPCAEGMAGVLIDEDDLCHLENENFNAFYSAESPFNVDMSSVRTPCSGITTPEDDKFMCIYDKLISSPKFKELFSDTFGESENLNVKFTIVDSLPISSTGEIPNANCGVISGTTDPTTGSIVDMQLEIKIRRGYMDTSSSFAVAKTILHECIHAYLTLKFHGCNDGVPFGEMDDVELSELINQYYVIACTGQSQHEFMYDYMLPTIKEVLMDVRDSLIPLTHRNIAEGYTFINEESPSSDELPWDWDQFYEYFSMTGLHKTDAFQYEMYPITSSKHQNYTRYADIGINSFKKECAE